VLETEKVKILWDVCIQMHHVIEHRRRDIVAVEKDNKTALLIDIAVPGDNSREGRGPIPESGPGTQQALESEY